ncbi:MAG TPA: Zn-ribbon domain-containing OB-fold protein [candidate division WOR-3 bacterium]|uniref:Zn-ribbon domain-containing OB-fold protein n=1 Tax=candidate division WOR-3 bacterium TaxID=2052148 RepID=A0A9C9K0A4_UNCW3|nr:Zn-ribbon domain-containing OB-fold protein [candidate division WOR-3 bacterium]
MPSPRYRREMPQRYRLEAGKCKKCGKISFPPRLICPACGSKDFEKTKLTDYGKIVSYTTIRVAPSDFATQVPYNIAIVESDNGVRVTTQVVDCKPEDLEIGKRVKFVFRKLSAEGHTGIICYGYKAVPV